MSKLIWESPGGTFRLLDKRIDLPRPLLELCAHTDGALHLAPEDVDDLWQVLTLWLHDLRPEHWDKKSNGVLELIRRERAALECEFADRLAKLDRKEAELIHCPFCGDLLDLHVNVEVQCLGERRLSRRCSVAGCSCCVMGEPSRGEDSHPILRESHDPES